MSSQKFSHTSFINKVVNLDGNRYISIKMQWKPLDIKTLNQHKSRQELPAVMLGTVVHIHTQSFYRQMSGAHTKLSFVAFAAVDI